MATCSPAVDPEQMTGRSLIFSNAAFPYAAMSQFLLNDEILRLVASAFSAKKTKNAGFSTAGFHTSEWISLKNCISSINKKNLRMRRVEQRPSPIKLISCCGNRTSFPRIFGDFTRAGICKHTVHFTIAHSTIGIINFFTALLETIPLHSIHNQVWSAPKVFLNFWIKFL
mmetsp:Transcript_10089/g.15021  ORF Transcript_10089/g.15021 Transcript_10089/m.15021 type:complete len:170 (+) Transcript_10089:834-1343(+)